MSHFTTGQVVTAADLNALHLLIAEATAGGTLQTLEVTNIPQTHRDLLVTVHGHNVGTLLRTVTVRLNGDSGSNYRYIRISSADNGSPTTASSQSATAWQVGSLGDETGLNVLRMEILDYTTGGQKAFTSQLFGTQGVTAGSSSYTSAGGAYAVSGAITQVSVIMSGDAWASGSVLKVYGLGLI